MAGVPAGRCGRAATVYGAERRHWPCGDSMDGDVVSWLFDPKIFNYLIMCLYALNACRWAFDGKWADMCYWLSALAITATVTFGYHH